MSFYRVERHPTAASAKLTAARAQARLQLRQVASALGVHPRTIRRWELGESRPKQTEWTKLAAYLARFVPDAAAQLAQAAGVASPLPPPVTVDERAIEEALWRAADQLDVSPHRVRAAVRALAAAVTHANGDLADLVRAAQEKGELVPPPTGNKQLPRPSRSR